MTGKESRRRKEETGKGATECSSGRQSASGHLRRAVDVMSRLTLILYVVSDEVGAGSGRKKSDGGVKGGEEVQARVGLSASIQHTRT